MRVSRQVDGGHSTTSSLLYHTQDSGSAECTVHSNVTFIDALAAFLCINSCISFLPPRRFTHAPQKISNSLW